MVLQLFISLDDSFFFSSKIFPFEIKSFMSSYIRDVTVVVNLNFNTRFVLKHHSVELLASNTIKKPQQIGLDEKITNHISLIVFYKC